MDFRELKKFLKSLGRDYDVPGYDCCVYYDHVYVFRDKGGMSDVNSSKKVSGKDLYFLHSGAKLMCCVAVMQLVERYKLSLKDNVCDYIDNFDSSYTVEKFLHDYSANLKNENDICNHMNMVRLIENSSGVSFGEFIRDNITEPLKMKSTTFELNEKNMSKIASQYFYDKSKSKATECDTNVRDMFEKNVGSLITGVEDYIKLCETICNQGLSEKNYRLLSPYSVDKLINEIIYNETEKCGAYVSVGYHGSLVLIDIKKRISIVYAQHMKNIDSDRLDMYPKLRKIAYECIGVDTWSKGYTVL